MRHIAQSLSTDLSNYFKVGHPGSYSRARNTAIILKFLLLPSFEDPEKQPFTSKRTLGFFGFTLKEFTKGTYT